MGHTPLDYTICDFQSGTKFVFSLHDTRMKFPTRGRISFAMKTGMTCTITKFRVGRMWKDAKKFIWRWNEPRAIIGQRGTLPVTRLGFLNCKKVIFRTMRTMRKQFPVNWLTSGRYSAPKRGGVNKWKKWLPRGGGSYFPYILLNESHNLQSDQQRSCQRICVLIMRITSKTIDQRSWEETRTWRSKAGLFLTIIFW